MSTDARFSHDVLSIKAVYYCTSPVGLFTTGICRVADIYIVQCTPSVRDGCIHCWHSRAMYRPPRLHFGLLMFTNRCLMCTGSLLMSFPLNKTRTFKNTPHASYYFNGSAYTAPIVETKGNCKRSVCAVSLPDGGAWMATLMPVLSVPSQ